jgi:hypothetical protein
MATFIMFKALLLRLLWVGMFYGSGAAWWLFTNFLILAGVAICMDLIHLGVI